MVTAALWSVIALLGAMVVAALVEGPKGRRELRLDIAGVKTELRLDIAGVKTELRHEIAGVKTELRHEIAGVKTELRQDLRATDAKVDALAREVHAMAGTMQVLVAGHHTHDPSVEGE